MTEELDRQLDLTADLVRVRLSMWDRADVPRGVDHSASFRRKADARTTAQELAALGYEVGWDRHWLRPVLEFTPITAV